MFRKYAVLLVGLFLLARPGLAAENDEAIRRQLQEPRLDCLAPQFVLDPASLELLREFYRLREFQPAWSGARLDGLFVQLEQLADDGLEPERYSLPALRQLRLIPDPAPGLLACLDTLASQAYLQALRHLRAGRLDPARFEPIWHAEGLAPVFNQTALLLQAEGGLDGLPQVFAEARPTFEPYLALRRVYAALRRQPLPDWPTIPDGPLLKPKALDERVPQLWRRLAAEGYLPERVEAPEARRYDGELVAAVQAFQRRQHLKADGILGAQTLAALNRSPAQRMEQLRVNLERLRWLSREVPVNGVLVNVAAAEVFFLRDGRPVWQARTQVGRPARKTPLLKSLITHLTLNPTWTVPPTILREDKLPEIRRDLGYLAANHLRVLDHAGHELDPQTLDWNNPGAILLRQDAGPHNALGRVALRFPNPFSVYLHDTPSQSLFDSLPRTFSSGCVRVERVGELVEQLLADASPAQRARLEVQWQSGRTQRADLPQPVPILLAYWTAQVDEQGEPLFLPDLYGYDARVARALNAD